ncbi:MAG: tRNA (adenosine(37)-N6)-dimethylallyltransferase MiaA [Ignavibacteriaceae bacterium]
MEPKIIGHNIIPVIVGPTCSGKTGLCLLLSERINCEIISADSRQIYKYLNIGTAKPSPHELKKVKHHFIDILEPHQVYNVSRFESEALQIIEEIIIKKKIPVAAGGSGLYVKALIDGIIDTVETDDEYRTELLERKNKYGNESIYEELKKVDPESASRMLPQNWKRIIRALEVFHLTGKPIGQHHIDHNREIKYNFMQFGLNWSRDKLYQNIEQRVDDMITGGLLIEVQNLIEKGYNKTLNALNTVGYKEIISYLDGEISLERAVELIKRNTRRYAKRQLTWFRADERIKWFDVNSKDDLDNIADTIVKNLQQKE